MEDTNLVNKAGMFISDDAWNLIPLNQGINFELSQTISEQKAPSGGSVAAAVRHITTCPLSFS